MDSDTLSNKLFEKVKPYLPTTIEVKSTIHAENGVWHLKELNSRLRFCKYSTHQYFHRHLDGIYYQDETTQSKLTFMIYLNSAIEFEGGRTLFYKTKDSKEIWAEYIPQQGDLIVFDHNVWHEGEVLTQGEKFVLRSDILYSKNETSINKGPFEGHLGYIWSLLKIDENTILSGGRDKEIKVWNVNGVQKYSLSGHKNSILCIAKMSSDIFISGSRDQEIIVWRDYKLLCRMRIHSAVVLSLCCLDNITFASSSGDNTVKISNLEGTVLKTFSEHTNWVWQVIKLDDSIIASCSEDNTIKIWDCKNENSINTFNSDHPIMCLAFNKQSRQLISGSFNGDISIRTLGADYQSKSIKSFKAHTGIIRTIKIINDGHIATGGEDNKVRIWSIEGKLLNVLEHQNFVQYIETLDQNTIMSASYDGTIKTWKV